MGKELERQNAEALDGVSMEEIEAEAATSLPNKEVMSLLDVNANVDLGLDLAAPIDLAVAANLNVAAPIEAAASANLLSPEAQAISLAQQQGSIDQGIHGTADATAPQHAEVSQDSNPPEGGDTSGTPAEVAPAADGSAGAIGEATQGASGAVDGAAGSVGDAAGGTVGDAAGDTAGDVGDAAGGAVGDVGDAAGGIGAAAGSLLSDGSLLDANVNIHANANVAAPIDGAVAANANVAAPIDAAVAANIGSDHAVAEALAPQQVDITQHLDDVEANATAQQDASVDQQ